MVANHRNRDTEHCIVLPTILKVEPLVYILEEPFLPSVTVGNTECDLALFSDTDMFVSVF